jgi:tetratricopeptide (TPR) repeat protein
MPSNASQLFSMSKSALEKNDIKKAVEACRSLNSQFPDFFEGWWLAGKIHLRLRNPKAGLISTSRALDVKPHDPEILIQRVDFLSMTERHDEVLETLKTLSEYDSGDGPIHGDIALLLSAQEMHQEATRHYLLAIKHNPNNSQLRYNLAAAYRFLGELGKCEESLNTCLKIDYLDADAQSMRSSLRTQSLENNHIEELNRAHSDSKISKIAKVGICYALAKELDDLDEIEQSFQYLKEGSDIRRSMMTYDIKKDEEIMDAIKQTFSSSPERISIPAISEINPIFIIGLPRSGTTLLERILDSHSLVRSQGELDTFGIEMARQVSKGQDQKNLSSLDMVNLSKTIDLEILSENYLSKASPKNFNGKYFIDKFPLNFLYVGLIFQAFPNAKIINLSRHPVASCLAMYKQLFRDIYPFSYNLTDLGRYYSAYHRLMDHWHSTIPGVIHSVAYEKLVTDTENEIRQVLDFCKLKWEPRCLKFYENTAPSTTASATQVRQPIYSKSLNRWRDYAGYLEELTQALNKAGIDVT